MTDPSFWLERWKSGEAGFHQSDAHDLLTRHWPLLGLAERSTVFVPLCGKSVDMVWLAAQGHQVIGCELSPIAIHDFFRSLNLVPQSTPEDGGLICHRAGPYTLYEGDFFSLTRDHVKDAVAAYDRASLVAFPETEQDRYVEKLAELMAGRGQVFLIALSFDQSQMSGPPFSVDRPQIEKLTARRFHCELIESRDGLVASDNLRKRGLTALDEAIFLLSSSSPELA